MTADLERRALRESLMLQVDRARGKALRGIALCMLSPIVALLTLFALLATTDNIVSLYVATGVVLAGLGFGGASIIVGTGQLRAAKRQVRELDEPIPRARLVD